MASNTKKQGAARKKAAGKTTKKTARKATRSVSKRAPARAGKKSAVARKAADKTATAARKPTRKAGKQAAKKPSKKVAKNVSIAAEPEDALLALDELSEVDDLVADAAELRRAGAPAGRKAKDRGPRTPSVPRAVKPPPKDADLEMSAEILEFVDAIDAYRQANCRPFPTWTEVFHILRQLGYSKS